MPQASKTVSMNEMKYPRILYALRLQCGVILQAPNGCTADQRILPLVIRCVAV